MSQISHRRTSCGHKVVPQNTSFSFEQCMVLTYAHMIKVPVYQSTTSEPTGLQLLQFQLCARSHSKKHQQPKLRGGDDALHRWILPTPCDTTNFSALLLPNLPIFSIQIHPMRPASSEPFAVQWPLSRAVHCLLELERLKTVRYNKGSKTWTPQCVEYRVSLSFLWSNRLEAH